MELRALSHLPAAHLIAPSLRGNGQGSLAERPKMQDLKAKLRTLVRYVQASWVLPRFWCYVMGSLALRVIIGARHPWRCVRFC